MAYYTEVAQWPSGMIQPYQSPEQVEYCAEWTPLASETERHLASASFELPTAADLFFLSLGPVSGHIDIVENPNDAKDLERTKACRMGPANDTGVLIWAEPRHPHGDPQRDVHFNITVALPWSAVRVYKDLTTDLPLFSHNVGNFFNLRAPSWFEFIRLKTSNKAIDHGIVYVRSVLLQTNKAKVQRGVFAQLLSVKTSNAPIIFNAIILGETGDETQVQLITSKGEIASIIGVLSDSADQVLRVATSIGPVTVSLPQYVGTYDLQTSGAAQAKITVNQNISDLTAKGDIAP
ncbi:hypothetical protein DFH09DRAFT_1079941 [Mycena vulgaris]|nr:hypothetical protein DFH09DRAFT_1079941 [Mycena vulgaris]